MSATFRRGFKTEAAKLVREIRNDFGVRPLDPLNPFELARHLHIPIVGLSIAGSDLVDQFDQMEGRFHAATVQHGYGHLIVHNDRASWLRQKSDVAHELGHIFLEHKVMPVNSGKLKKDSAPEREADWFGFSLLITDEAALSLARSNLSIPDCAQLLQVSEQAMRFRLNASGAARRARNERNRRSQR